MRKVGLSDLHHAARAVQTVHTGAGAALSQQLLWHAHVADKYVKRLHRLHPAWGDGSLRAAALAHLKHHGPLKQPPDYCLSMAVVLTALARQRGKFTLT